MAHSPEDPMTEPSERAQELASRHEGLQELAELERAASASVTLAETGVACATAFRFPDSVREEWEGLRMKMELKAALDASHHRFLKGLGTDFFRWLAEHHERTMT